MSGKASQLGLSNYSAVTIDDVAKASGVSISTVSRALNGKGKNNWQSAQRRTKHIKKIAKDLGYQPNAISQALAKGKSNTIGVIGKGLGYSLAQSHIYYLISQAQEQGYDTYVTQTGVPGDDSEALVRKARKLIARQVDGLVIRRSLPLSKEAQNFLESLNIPVVFMGGWGPKNSNHHIYLDFESGTKEVAQHLAQLGHKCAVHFASEGQTDYPEHKLRPYQRSFNEMEIELLLNPPHELNVNPQNVGEMAYEVVSKYLADSPSATALLMSNDEAAAAAISAARNAGFNVPGDISIVGFDNLQISRFCYPPLTTVGCGAPKDIGAATFNMLHTLMQDRSAQVEKQIFPFKLVARQSTGRLRSAYQESGSAGVGGTGVSPVVPTQCVGWISETHPSKQKVDALEDSLIHPTNSEKFFTQTTSSAGARAKSITTNDRHNW